MTRYLISFDAHAMDHIPDEEMPDVATAAHEVVEEALNAGVWVFRASLGSARCSTRGRRRAPGVAIPAAGPRGWPG